MKKSLKITLIVVGVIVLLFVLLALTTQSYFEEIEETVYATTEVENVSTTISDISLTGATITIKDTNESKYTYEEWYVLEKEIDGKMYSIPTKVKDYGFNSKGYSVDENNEVKFVIDWKWLYGELPQGSYRIIKKSHDKYISIPFDIAQTSNVNTIKFNEYITRDEGRIVYLAGNMNEFYVKDSDNKKVTLKDYSKTWQSLDDIINHITSGFEEQNTLNDGGTKIYKSKINDTTIVVCHTSFGNKDVFIGNYNMQFDNESMCKR